MFDTMAVLKCPHCGESSELEMPTTYCQIVHVCQSCGERITPKEGDCCIFCSYANIKCPTMQRQDERMSKAKLKVFIE